ncbi:hypothetical protein [Undibacterium griseum]|uniref:Uncharacterized protein n=1 Tax=Undibacterium griseum TaxID=2762295 RepID=A0ABR6YJP6_9BURK|nr:hypothetical protein [Undibacterium griseum]MBC3884120.1 hypothetical protein [Undibacterium griseum]
MFYLEFYRELLEYPTKDEGKRLIAKARDHASASPYIVFSKSLALP